MSNAIKEDIVHLKTETSLLGYHYQLEEDGKDWWVAIYHHGEFYTSTDFTQNPKRAREQFDQLRTNLKIIGSKLENEERR